MPQWVERVSWLCPRCVSLPLSLILFPVQVFICPVKKAKKAKKKYFKKKSLYNILLLSQRGFNLFETWSLHSSVLPHALFLTPSLSAYTNTQNRKKKKNSDKLRFIVIALLSSASLQELLNKSNWIERNQVDSSPLTPMYSGVLRAWSRFALAAVTQISSKLDYRQKNEFKGWEGEKNYLGWKDVAGQMFRWKASPEIEYLSIFSVCGRLIDAGFRAVTWMHAPAHILNTEAKPLAIQKQYARTQRYMKQFMSLTGFNLAH